MSYDVAHVQRQLRRPNVVVAGRAQVGATPFVPVLVIAGVYVAKAYGSLQTPPVAKSPCVAQRQSAAYIPPLVAVAPQWLQQSQWQPLAASVVLAAQQVHAPEPALHRALLLQPASPFGHQAPVAQLLVVRECPGVQTVEQLQRRVSARDGFHADVQCQRGVVDKVVLDAPRYAVHATLSTLTLSVITLSMLLMVAVFGVPNDVP